MRYQAPSRSFGWPRRVAAWVLPLALVLMLAELAILARLLTTPNEPAGSVAGVSQVGPVPTAAAPSTLAPTAAAPTRPAAPAAAPPTTTPPAPTAAPTADPRPPTPTTQPQPAGPVAPAVAPVPPLAGVDTPTGAVTRFYQLVEQGQFDAAAALWSQRMRSEYPPAGNINGRFARTERITVRRADLISADETNGRAAVAVDLQEVLDTGASRRWTGTWYLVRGPSGWLLDQPSLSGG